MLNLFYFQVGSIYNIQTTSATSRVSTEDKFQFLISCIRHSNDGKVDFEKVASECEIVSRGAASKRYTRLIKAHDIHTPGGANDDLSPKIIPSPKKRKVAEDDGEPETPTREKKDVKAEIAVKNEDEKDGELNKDSSQKVSGDG